MARQRIARPMRAGDLTAARAALAEAASIAERLDGSEGSIRAGRITALRGVLGPAADA